MCHDNLRDAMLNRLNQPKIFAWQQATWNSITARGADFHHANLLAGPSGIGKREFAVALAAYYLCGSDEKEQHAAACGECRNCRLVAAGSHPDLHVITHEHEAAHGRINTISAYSDRYLRRQEWQKKTKLSQVIGVDAVRTLIDNFSSHTHLAKIRVALLLPAETLNINAANALLKILEEPPAATLFILLAATPERLLPTICSRCILHHLPAPDRTTAVKWLQQNMADASAADCAMAWTLANGGLLEARTLWQSGTVATQQNYVADLIAVLTKKVMPLAAAERFMPINIELLLVWLQHFIIALVKWRELGLRPPWAEAGHQLEPITRLSRARLFALYDTLCQYRRSAFGAINQQLVVEELLFALQRTSIESR